MLRTARMRGQLEEQCCGVLGDQDLRILERAMEGVERSVEADFQAVRGFADVADRSVSGVLAISLCDNMRQSSVSP